PFGAFMQRARCGRRRHRCHLPVRRFKRGIVSNNSFATRAPLSDVGSLECSLGPNGRHKGRSLDPGERLPTVTTATPPANSRIATRNESISAPGGTLDESDL